MTCKIDNSRFPYFKLGKVVAETRQMFKKAFVEDALDHSQTYEWSKHFKGDS
jgi:hypothetical protein